jgi:phosphatidylserine/phosphatidylglycerophosphate/cardiolipin synthase-like enzyme
MKEGDLATLRKLHHKLMVIDDRIIVAGSFNYTQPANDYNDENLFVIWLAAQRGRRDRGGGRPGQGRCRTRPQGDQASLRPQRAVRSRSTHLDNGIRRPSARRVTWRFRSPLRSS